MLVADLCSDEHGYVYLLFMETNPDELTRRILATLTETERQQSVVYIDTTLYQPGSTIRINRQIHSVTEPTVLAFVDLQPTANWGHPCRYFLLHPVRDTLETTDASFPPDTAHLAIASRGETIQDWMLLTSTVLDK